MRYFKLIVDLFWEALLNLSFKGPFCLLIQFNLFIKRKVEYSFNMFDKRKIIIFKRREIIHESLGR